MRHLKMFKVEGFQNSITCWNHLAELNCIIINLLLQCQSKYKYMYIFKYYSLIHFFFLSFRYLGMRNELEKLTTWFNRVNIRFQISIIYTLQHLHNIQDWSVKRMWTDPHQVFLPTNIQQANKQEGAENSI
jgi:hypothetical protein